MKHLPAVLLVGPDGGTLAVHPGDEHDTVGDLSSALGWDEAAGITVDGAVAAPAERLVDVARLRHGASIAPATGAPAAASCPTDTTHEPVVDVAVVAGPACRGWAPLAPGAYRVGRANHCEVRLLDPDVELHHGRLEVSADGSVDFRQLTGRVPATVHGRRCAEVEPLHPGEALRIGASSIEVRMHVADRPCAPAAGRREHGSLVSGPDPWRRTVRRGPPRTDPSRPAPIEVPAPPTDHPSPPATGLVGAAVAAVAAFVAGSLLGQGAFALFAVIGALGSAATWSVGVAVAARRRRASRRAHRLARAGFCAEVDAAAGALVAARRRANPGVVEVIDEVAAPTGLIWERRITDAAPVRATVGTGPATLPVPVGDGRDALPPDLASHVARASAAADEPATVELVAGSATAIHGPRELGSAVGRSIVTQLATWYGPADWQLVVVTSDPAAWMWTSWLPHGDGCSAIVAADEVVRLDDVAGGGRLVVVVTDEPSLFDSRTGPFRRFLDTTAAAVLAIVPPEQSVPALCSRTLVLGATGSGRWSHRSPTDDLPQRIRVSGLDEHVATRVARSLAPLDDPECDDAAHDAPAEVTYAQLHRDPARLGLDAETVERYWRDGGPDPAPRTPIGMSADGIVDLDLVRDGPHGLIAGTTGSGKSELLRTLVVGLATRVGPDHVSFVLVDYKGGATFDACERLPHTVGMVTDLDEGGAERALVSLDAELRRRERILRSVGAGDLTEYRRCTAEPLPRLVVVVDEFAALAKELPDFLSALVDVAQRGRSLGVHLVLATQRPAGVVSDDIRANTNLRLALRLHDPADARDVVGDDLPATVPRGLAGRAVLRLGPDELLVFQAGRCTGVPTTAAAGLRIRRSPGRAGASVCSDPASQEDDETASGETELTLAVHAIREAAARVGVAAPHRPWRDPLPEVIATADLDAFAPAIGEHRNAVGVVDDPGAQAQRGLRWGRSGGNLALVGPLGSGTTTALVAVAVARCRDRGPDSHHLYVLDGHGDAALDRLADVAHCGAVVRTIDSERVDRLLRRLDSAIDDRLSSGAVEPAIVVAIDGYHAVRASLADRWDTVEMLERILADGPAVGIESVLTVAGDPVPATVGDRWTFTGPPGRIRVASSGLEAHVVIDPPLHELPGRSSGAGPAAVDVLPEVIRAGDLGASRRALRASGGADHLVIGRSGDDLADAALTVPAGDHVLVAGPSRSGKTTALGMLSTAWRVANPDGRTVVVGRHAPPSPDVLDGTRVLLIVDDCDRIDDGTGVLSTITGEHHPDVTILAAGRPEAIRGRYGHWSREVARHRCGLLMALASEVDADLFGIVVPKRTSVPPRPGLAWFVDAGELRLAQLATPSESEAGRADGGSSSGDGRS